MNAQRRRSTTRRVQNRVRGFNKRVLNPFVLRLAGRPGAPSGVVRHVGRRTGRTYDTPVLVGTMDDAFVVPLLYGSDVDWYQNVRAAEGCTVVWQGSAYRAEAPRLISPSVAAAAFPGPLHRVLGRSGAGQFLRLERGEAVPGAYREVAERYPPGPAVAGLAGVALLAGLVAWQLVDRDD